MDASVVPLVLAALVVGIAGTWMELRASLEPAACPECAHCREQAELRRLERLAQERHQAELQATYSRRLGLDDRRDEDDVRRPD
jgi:DNA-binding FadR family transcriptional regulator